MRRAFAIPLLLPELPARAPISMNGFGSAGGKMPGTDYLKGTTRTT